MEPSRQQGRAVAIREVTEHGAGDEDDDGCEELIAVEHGLPLLGQQRRRRVQEGGDGAERLGECFPCEESGASQAHRVGEAEAGREMKVVGVDGHRPRYCSVGRVCDVLDKILRCRCSATISHVNIVSEA